MTIRGSDGRPVQVPQAVVAQAQLGLVQPGPDGSVTVPGPDGKAIKIPQSALMSAATSVLPNGGGMHETTFHSEYNAKDYGP